MDLIIVRHAKVVSTAQSRGLPRVSHASLESSQTLSKRGVLNAKRERSRVSPRKLARLATPESMRKGKEILSVTLARNINLLNKGLMDADAKDPSLKPQIPANPALADLVRR